jgi:phage-related protein
MFPKPLLWAGSSRSEIRRWPSQARRVVGYQLHLVQQGLDPYDWRPMPEVGLGVYEIRLHEGGERRVFFIAKFREAVYVLHAFRKSTRATSAADIALGRQRLRHVLAARKDSA